MVQHPAAPVEYDDAVARAPGQTAAQDKERDFRASADAIIGPAPTGVRRAREGCAREGRLSVRS